MLLNKLIWIVQLAVILYGVCTCALPMKDMKKHGGSIAVSLMMPKHSDEPNEDMEEGFCLPPQSGQIKKMNVDDIIDDCGSLEPSWTFSQVKDLKAAQDIVLPKSLPSLGNLNQVLRRFPGLVAHR